MFMQMNKVVGRLGCRVLLMFMIVCCSPEGRASDELELREKSGLAFAHLTQNVSFAYTSNLYGDMPFGKKYGTKQVHVIANTSTLTRSSVEWQSEIKLAEKRFVWSDASRLLYLRPTASNRFEIHREHVPWTGIANSDYFAAAFEAMGLEYFFVRPIASEFCRLRCDYSLSGSTSQKVTSVSSVPYKSMDCWKAVMDHGQSPIGRMMTEYYVSKSHGMVVASRQDKTPHIARGQTSPGLLQVAKLTEITYGPPTENGLPFPKAVKGWYVWPDGKREPSIDLEFTEFRRYTPKPEELDFEKLFGIALPELPPRPSVVVARSNPWIFWLTIAFVVSASVTVLAFVWRRLRRRRSLSDSPPFAGN